MKTKTIIYNVLLYFLITYHALLIGCNKLAKNESVVKSISGDDKMTSQNKNEITNPIKYGDIRDSILTYLRNNKSLNVNIDFMNKEFNNNKYDNIEYDDKTSDINEWSIDRTEMTLSKEISLGTVHVEIIRREVYFNSFYPKPIVKNIKEIRERIR